MFHGETKILKSFVFGPHLTSSRPFLPQTRHSVRHPHDRRNAVESSVARKRILAELSDLRTRVHREKLREIERESQSMAQSRADKNSALEVPSSQTQNFSLTPSVFPLASRAECKLINDPIHGHILLEPELVKVGGKLLLIQGKIISGERNRIE